MFLLPIHYQEPSDEYDIFRVMTGVCAILDDRGYDLGNYEHLLGDDPANAKRTTEIERYEEFLADYNEYKKAAESQEDVEETAKERKKRSKKETTHESLWKFKVTFEMAGADDDSELHGNSKAHAQDIDVYKILKKRTDIKYRKLIIDEINELEEAGENIIMTVNDRNPSSIAYKTNAKIGDVIEILSVEDKVQQDPIYVKVVYPSPLTVVVCEKDQVSKIIYEEFGKTAEHGTSKKRKLKHWMIISSSLADIGEKLVYPGDSIEMRFNQQLYINPFTHVKSPPAMRKLNKEEKRTLKIELDEHGYSCPIMKSEDPAAIRLNAEVGDYVKIHQNCIYSGQSISSLLYRQVED